MLVVYIWGYMHMAPRLLALENSNGNPSVVKSAKYTGLENGPCQKVLDEVR